jgi:hypothetical protein
VRGLVTVATFFVLLASACGGEDGIEMPESERVAVREASVDFAEALAAGDNERACALTTDPALCLETLSLAEEYLIDTEYIELALGRNWRERLRAAAVTFSDANHATIAPIMPGGDGGDNELVREDGAWLTVIDENSFVIEVED